MRALRVFAVLCAATVCWGAAPETGGRKLREIVRLPPIDFSFRFEFHNRVGWILRVSGVTSDDEREITKLRGELKGDGTDAERFARLSLLYESSHDETNSTAAAKKAAELFRPRIELQPDNALLLTAFGEALSDAGRIDEAESVLRKATRIAPAEWKGWNALGNVLDREAVRAWGNPSFSPEDALVGRTPETLPTATQMKEAEKLLDASGECFDKAVTSATNEAHAYCLRAFHRYWRNAIAAASRSTKGNSNDRDQNPEAIIDHECIRDFREVARLSPSDPVAIGGCACFEVYGQMLSQKTSFSSGEEFWNALPEDTRRAIQQALTRLETLAESQNRPLAGGALTSMAALRASARGDLEGACRNLRRSLDLDPGRDEAWEFLIGLYGGDSKFEVMLPLCEDRVKKRDGAYQRFVLAKVYDRLHRPDQAEEQVRAVLKKEPENVWGSLALASLLLKRGSNEEALREAGELLAKIYPVIEKEPDTAANDALKMHYFLTTAIYYSLIGNAEHARQTVRKILDSDKDNDYAKEILSALGQ